MIPWAIILPTLLELLGKLCPPKNPEPVIPIVNPTPVQSAAWTDAWGFKSGATDNWDGNSYHPKTINKTAAKIRRTNKHNGKPMTKAEAVDAAVLALDDARLSPMPELYSDVLEARHAV